VEQPGLLLQIVPAPHDVQVLKPQEALKVDEPVEHDLLKDDCSKEDGVREDLAEVVDLPQSIGYRECDSDCSIEEVSSNRFTREDQTRVNHFHNL
jgi:hypothetical protein